ncbi:MAG: hypothetical protein WHT09_08425 [Thermogutta sp.]
MNTLSFAVAPHNGSARRIVIVTENGAEIFRDKIDVDDASARGRFFERLGEKLQQPGRELLRVHEKTLLALADEADRVAAAEAKANERTEQWEPPGRAKEEAARILERPDLLACVADAAEEAGVVGERPLVILAYLVATSRLLDRPLYLLLQGPPASGKSFIANKVAELLPRGIVWNISDATANSLYYLEDPTALHHKVLILGERRRQLSEEAIDATKALRELVETGWISKLVPIRTLEGLQTIRLELKGAPSIIETCAHGAIGEEDISRMILAWPDESEPQTRRVITAMAMRKATGGGGLAEEKRIVIQALQTLLEPFPVRIPFLPELAQKFPTGSVEARRVFPRWVGLIEASAVLHQRQRECQDGCLIAVEDDARLAWRLVAFWVKHRLMETPPPAVLKVWEEIRARGRVLQSELINAGVASRPSVRRAISYLEKQGVVEAVNTGKTKEVIVKNPNWTPSDFDLFDTHSF